MRTSRFTRTNIKGKGLKLTFKLGKTQNYVNQNIKTQELRTRTWDVQDKCEYKFLLW